MQKICVGQHRVRQEFQVGGHLYLGIKPKKSYLRIGTCPKLAPFYCGPFEFLERLRPVVYRLVLPPSIRVHDVSHVSLIKQYVQESNFVIDWSVL